MDHNDRARLEELSRKIDFLCGIILKARQYARSDPETALMQARKSAEAVCRHIFSVEIGEPGIIMLDDLIKRLAQKHLLPRQILLPLGTIQAYGNYGSHAQSEHDTIDMAYITLCLSALAQVTNWYFLEYLHIDIPDQIKDVERQSPSPPGFYAGEHFEAIREGTEGSVHSYHRPMQPLQPGPTQPPAIPTDLNMAAPAPPHNAPPVITQEPGSIAPPTPPVTVPLETPMSPPEVASPSVSDETLRQRSRRVAYPMARNWSSALSDEIPRQRSRRGKRRRLWPGVVVISMMVIGVFWVIGGLSVDEQFRTAQRYYAGEGVPQDYAKALEWYRKAADQEHAEAQHNLGVMYAYGQGVIKYEAEAVRWYRKAAEQGHSAAQERLRTLQAPTQSLNSPR